MSKSTIRLLYLTAEAWPTHRADIISLFGKWLPKFAVKTDLLTERAEHYSKDSWAGGDDLTFQLPKEKSLFYILKFIKLLFKTITKKAKDYDAIQVRDMPIVAFFVLLIANSKSIPFYYWMSYPQSEGQISRALARGYRAGMRYWFPLIQGSIGKFLLYKYILLKSDHIFVQSEQMLKDLAALGIPVQKMTPVPMGVDTDAVESMSMTKCDDARLNGKYVLAYLGTLDRARNIEVLFGMLKQVLTQFPSTVLLLIGDTEDKEHRSWLEGQALIHNVEKSVIWTGWLSTDEAWSYVRRADIGLSPIPRGHLLDCSSPTKVIEYMAIGIPVIGNDNPDQQLVLSESGAGLCTKFDENEFSQAVIKLLSCAEMRQRMSENGKQYVSQKRGYHKLAEELSSVYMRLIN